MCKMASRNSHFTFAGRCGGRPSSWFLLAWLRQLLLDRLVAAVDTLRELPLLYLVNPLVDVPALAIELRQLLDAIELALDARGRPLRVLVGDTPRSLRLSLSAP